MRRSIFVAAGLAACAVAGCGAGGSAGGPAQPAATGSSAASSAGSLTVFAATSLQGSFTQIGKDFDAIHPGEKVTLSFGPSSGLARQITSGAPADVFASAAMASMQQVVKAGDAASPSDFARNIREIAYPIAAIKNSSHAAMARAFVSYVLSPPGQKVLSADGFEKP